MKFSRDAARHYAAQRSHGAVGGQGRAGGLPQAGQKILFLFFRKNPVPLLGAPAGGLQQRPAEMKIGCVGVQAEADKNSGVVQPFFAQPGVGYGFRRRVQHKQLLWQHFLELFWRDPVGVSGRAHLAQIKAFFIPPGQAAAALRAKLGGRRAGPAQNGLLELPQPAERAEARLHAHDGDRGGNSGGGPDGGIAERRRKSP